MSRPPHAGPLPLPIPCPRSRLTGRLPHRWGERGTPGTEAPQRNQRMATRWRCGSGDSGRCPTQAPRTWDPGRTEPTAPELPREGLDPERAEGLLRTLSQARATGTPLRSLLHPGWGTEASSGSAAPGGEPRTPQRPAGSGQHRGCSLPAVPSSFPLGSSPARPASPSPLLSAQPFFLF